MSESFYVRDRRAGNWFWIENNLIDQYGPVIGANGLAVYSILSRFSRHGETFVSHAKIGQLCDMSVSTVIRTLKLLEDQGLIERRSGKDLGVGNVYILLQVGGSVKNPVTDEEKPGENKGGSSIHEVPRGSVKPGGVCQKDGEGLSNDPSHNRKNKTINKTKNTGLFEDPPVSSDDDPPAPEGPPGWQEVVRGIDEGYRKVNNGGRPPWSSAAFGKLKRELTRHPSWTTTDWLRCIGNRFASQKVNLGESPESFIPKLKDFYNGPLNQFGGTSEVSHGKPTLTDRNRSAADRARERIRDAEARRTNTHTPGEDRGGYGSGTPRGR